MSANIPSSYGTPELWGLPPNAAAYLGKHLPVGDHMRVGVVVQSLSTNFIDAYDQRMGRTDKSLNRLLTLLNAPAKTDEEWLQEAGYKAQNLVPKQAKALIRHVQAQYIKNVIAPQWTRQSTTALLQRLTTQDKDALTMLRLLPGKVVRQEDGALDYSNNNLLARQLAKANDSHCFEAVSQPRQAAPQEGAVEPPITLLETFGAVMQSLTTAGDVFRSLLSINVDDADKNKEEVAFAEALLTSFGPLDDTIGTVLQEFIQLNKQLNKNGPHQAYSMSLNSVTMADPALYMHLNDLHKAENVQATWNKIPVKLLKEYALPFGGMLLRLGAKHGEEAMLPIVRQYFQTVMPETEDTPIKQALRQIATSFSEREENPIAQ